MDHSQDDVTAMNTTATQGCREDGLVAQACRRAEEVTEHDQEGIVSTSGEGRGLLPSRRVGLRRVAICGTDCHRRELEPGFRHRTKNLSVGLSAEHPLARTGKIGAIMLLCLETGRAARGGAIGRNA